MMRLQLLSMLSIAFTLGTGCEVPPASELCVGESPTQEARCQCASSIVEGIFDDRVRRELDLLLVIDNSPGMADKQRAAIEALGAQLPSLEHLDYHIGVVTTDVGAWRAPSTPFAMPLSGCESFAGDDGRLQAMSCLDRKDLSAESMAACSALCSGRHFVPMDGAHFIANRGGQKNVPSRMDLDPSTGWPIDRGPQQALQCLALVGDRGCALTSPLEAMKRALDGHLVENSGFLRPTATLAVVIVTDKDDCSVPIEKRADNDPASRDCAISDDNAPLDCFNPQFRCTVRSVRCDQPMGSAGNKTGCRDRATGQLESVAKYARFLQLLRLPEKTILLGMWPLPSLLDGAPITVEQLPATSGSSRLFARPSQLRLSSLASALSSMYRPPREVAIGDPHQYAEALRSALDPPIECKLLGRCFPAAPRLSADGNPACIAGFVDEATPEATPDVTLPVCSAGCCNAMLAHERSCLSTWPLPIAEHCRAEPTDCYCIGPASDGRCRETAVVEVWRRDNKRAPPDAVFNIRCAAQKADCGPQ